jgi:hypothetical protein
MMKSIKEEKKQSSLLNQKIRRAEFVPVEELQSTKFKYHLRFLKLEKISQWLIGLKRSFNSLWQGIKLRVKKVDWNLAAKDSSVWLIEAFIEGVTINFATHFLFGLKINICTILAYGIFVKQGIDIYWRLKNNGPNTKIPTKN